MTAQSITSNQFADEEVESSYAYPNGYTGPKPIYQQIKIIHELFPRISWGYFRPDEDLIVVPKEAEGLFAIPRWDKIAPTYGEAVEKVLAMIASKRKFCNYRDGQLGAEYLRQHGKSVKMFQKLGDEQKDFDILVVPAQFGLGAFAIGIMLLTHPERLVQWEQLHVDCAGDEFSPDADGDFSYAPLFGFVGGLVKFCAYWFDHANELYGSASAFVSPQ